MGTVFVRFIFEILHPCNVGELGHLLLPCSVGKQGHLLPCSVGELGHVLVLAMQCGQARTLVLVAKQCG